MIYESAVGTSQLRCHDLRETLNHFSSKMRVPVTALSKTSCVRIASSSSFVATVLLWPLVPFVSGLPAVVPF